MAEMSWYYIALQWFDWTYWHYITPSIHMEFFYFKTQFVGFQFIDIDNQTPRVD